MDDDTVTTKRAAKTRAAQDRYVLVRASAAGVHVGVLGSASGDRAARGCANEISRMDAARICADGRKR